MTHDWHEKLNVDSGAARAFLGLLWENKKYIISISTSVIFIPCWKIHVILYCDVICIELESPLIPATANSKFNLTDYESQMKHKLLGLFFHRVPLHQMAVTPKDLVQKLKLHAIDSAHDHHTVDVLGEFCIASFRGDRYWTIYHARV